MFGRFGRAVARGANNISPLSLFNKNQTGKLLRDFGPDPYQGIPDVGRAIRKGYSGSKRSMVSDYVAGHDLERVGLRLAQGGPLTGGLPSSLANSAQYEKLRQTRAVYRQAAMGAAAVAYPGSLMLGDNPVSDAGHGVVSAGVAGAAIGIPSILGSRGPALNKLGKAVGTQPGGLGWKIGAGAIAAKVGYNAFSAGDNWGPF